MPDLPVPRWPVLNVITPWHQESLGLSTNALGTAVALWATATGVSTAANAVFYYPFLVYEPATAVKMSYIVGGVQNGNCDLGIYDSSKNKLVSSGTTAQGAINTLQELDITDTALTPGIYMMAITLSSATGTFFRSVPADELSQSSFPMLTETTGVFGLPTTAAWASSTNATPPIVAMGVHFDTLI